MDRMHRTAFRAAMLIHEQLAVQNPPCDSICFPEHPWQSVSRLTRQIGRASRRGWHGAAQRLAEDLASTLEEYRRYADNALQIVKGRPSLDKVAAVADIYCDILALYDEFEEEAKIDFEEHEICVTTDAIVLEDIRFGRFEIRLDWQKLGSSLAYRVVALDPNPAAKSEDITHPHVQDERLCEGEGRTAIRAALTQGRIHEFFLLVSQVLHTYGRGSAYVELDDWDGSPCEDCGQSASQDDRYYCSRCESLLCDSCALSCRGCDETHCSGCLDQCAACGEDFCSACLTDCPVCHKRFCDGCREDGLCRSCYEEQHNKENQDDPPATEAICQPARRRQRSACAPA